MVRLAEELRSIDVQMGERSAGPQSLAGGLETAGRRVRPWLYAWLALLPVALLRATTMAESDTFWEIRAGLEIVRRGAIPTVDTFSWTASGHAWTLNSWAFDVLLGATYRIGGLPLVALLGAAFVALILALALLLAQRLGASPALAATLLWLSAPLVFAWLSVRPQLVDYAGALTLVLLLRSLAQRGSPARALTAVGLLTLLWVNLHAAAVFELGILGAAVSLSLLTRLTRVWTFRLLLALLVAGSCCLLNPYGISVLTQTNSVQTASTGVVVEWQSANLQDPAQAVIIAAGVLALALAARRRDAASAAAALVSGGGALLAMRLLPILWLLAAPLLAAACSRPRVVGYLNARRPVVITAALLAPAAMLTLAVPGLSHLGQPNPLLYPRPALIKAIPSNCRVFNTYLQGGLLLLERPDVFVSTDSRNDLYGPTAVLTNAHALKSGNSAVIPEAADCALLPPTSKLTHALESDPDWNRRANDPAAILFTRK